MFIKARNFDYLSEHRNDKHKFFTRSEIRGFDLCPISIIKIHEQFWEFRRAYDDTLVRIRHLSKLRHDGVGLRDVSVG